MSTFVFTGKLSNMTRKQAAEIVCARGDVFSNRVTKKDTDYLVIGQLSHFPSHKIENVLKFNRSGQNIKVLTEEQFLNMV